MSGLTIELPPQAEQTAVNMRHWTELLANPELRKIEGRIETDRHGHIIMSPPSAPRHGRFQSQIVRLLQNLLPHGEIVTECPISTADGVKAADVAWASVECWQEMGNRAFFPRSPEICVEVLSPGNTEAEIREKMALYFDSGAQEAWLCGIFGAMQFFGVGPTLLVRSRLYPTFPEQIEVRPG